MEIIPDQKLLPLLVAKLWQILFRGLLFFLPCTKWLLSPLWQHLVKETLKTMSEPQLHPKNPPPSRAKQDSAAPKSASALYSRCVKSGQGTWKRAVTDVCQVQGHLEIWNIIEWNTIHERENCIDGAKKLWLSRVKIRRTNLIHSKVCKNRA